MRRAALALAVSAGSLALAGCESSQEKSAKLEKLAKAHVSHIAASEGTSLSAQASAHPSKVVQVLGASVIHSSEGSAVVVTLHNRGAHALHSIPIAITVKDASGKSVYSNNTPGLAPSLASLGSLAPHATADWVDDQVQASGTPASVTALVGEGQTASGALPAISVSGQAGSEAGSVEGKVTQHSGPAQHELIVYAVARRGAHVSAAGRAIVTQLSPATPSKFQIFMIGEASGARLEFSAPPTTLG